MAARDTESSAMFWSWISWGGALVGAIVVGIIVADLIGAGRPAGLIFGGVAFVVLGYVLTFNLPRRERAETVAVHAPALHAPAAHVPEPAPAAPPPAHAPEPGAGISERVREAARAAGEAARAATAVPPAAATAVPPAAVAEPARPASLVAPREGGPDDLKLIKGVGPKLEEMLHGLGYYHFDQVAAWSASEVAWVDAHIEGFSGRAVRDDWVGQARILAAGGETEHSRLVDRGEG